MVSNPNDLIFGKFRIFHKITLYTKLVINIELASGQTDTIFIELKNSKICNWSYNDKTVSFEKKKLQNFKFLKILEKMGLPKLCFDVTGVRLC